MSRIDLFWLFWNNILVSLCETLLRNLIPNWSVELLFEALHLPPTWSTNFEISKKKTKIISKLDFTKYHTAFICQKIVNVLHINYLIMYINFFLSKLCSVSSATLRSNYEVTLTCLGYSELILNPELLDGHFYLKITTAFFLLCWITVVMK